MKKTTNIILKILVVILGIYLLAFIFIKSSPLLDRINDWNFLNTSPDWVAIPTILIILALYITIPIGIILGLVWIAWLNIELKTE